jgi:drug/metabolite transporter (DMT)-like permease
VYGALSLVLLLTGGSVLRRIVRLHWRPALVFAVTGNVGYYLLLVIGIELVGAPVVTIIIGIIPVTMAVVGNLLTRTYRWRTLAVPIVLATVGMLLVNVLALGGTSTRDTGSGLAKVLGVSAAVGAVVLWTWYGLANASFLTRHPALPQVGWATVVGLGTGVVTLVMMPVAAVTGQLQAPARADTREVVLLVAACLVLGVLVSWAAAALWNVASARLPPTAAGMLINVETLAGFTYVYLALGEWPPIGQVVGFAMILAGVARIVRLPIGRQSLPVEVGRRSSVDAAS